MILTIFTDASHCMQLNVGSWACWMRDKNRKVEHYAAFKQPVRSSLCAELGAIANALKVAKVNGMFEGVTMIVIVTDSLNSKQRIEKRVHKNKPACTGDHPKYSLRKDALDLICNTLKESGLRCKVNHVKGHNGTGTPRNWVNDRVDRLSKKALREARKK